MENKITITRTIDDLKTGYKLYNAKHNKRSKYLSWIQLAIGMLFVFLATEGQNPTDKFLIAYIFIVYGSFSIWNRYNAAQKGVKINPDILNEETLIITDEELESQTDGCIMRIKWFAFVDAIVSEQMVLLYVNRVSFLLYPRRFFSEEEFTFLKDKANQTIAKNKSLTRYRDSK
jgi:hypothetical protein